MNATMKHGKDHNSVFKNELSNKRYFFQPNLNKSQTNRKLIPNLDKKPHINLLATASSKIETGIASKNIKDNVPTINNNMDVMISIFLITLLSYFLSKIKI